MSIMGKVAKLDSAMQRGLDNSFAFVFGGKLVPAEIEELLKQEVQDNIVRTYEGGVESPNVFRVRVSRKDAQNLAQRYPALADDFADRLSRYTRNQGWSTEGPVVVTIAADSGLRTGQLHASSAFDPAPQEYSRFIGVEDDVAAAAPTNDESNYESESGMNSYDADPRTEYMTAQAPDAVYTEVPVPEPKATPTVSLLLQDGSSRTYLVEEGSNIIGRSNEAHFRLPDTGVSRQHAEITWNGRDAILTDLKSTNGTTVNDTPVENWLLEDGDVITVGHSHIEVRIVEPN